MPDHSAGGRSRNCRASTSPMVCSRSLTGPASSESRPTRNWTRAKISAAAPRNARFRKNQKTIFAESGKRTPRVRRRGSGEVGIGVDEQVAGGAHRADEARHLGIVAELLAQGG